MGTRLETWRRAVLVSSVVVGCGLDPVPRGHGPIAEGISGRLGDPLPDLSAERLGQFERGREMALTQFLPSDGLGPAFNVSSCAGCHERPTVGGSAGLYRNFTLAGTTLDGEGFLPATSAGPAGSVLRMYYYGDEFPARPPVEDTVNTFAHRNPIPFFGVGLIAELSNEEILEREDEDDRDGDGISGRANYDRGFVGRFGRKSQTVSIEGFIRGPLFNHLGVTTDPLTPAQQAALPVDSSGGDPVEELVPSSAGSVFRQAAAPETSLLDDDGVPDPEMTTEQLFDLVAFTMLTAAPELEELTDQGARGRVLFDELACSICHAPRLNGPRGPLPLYSDLLLHDMGPDLADGQVQQLATGAEFRTQPLWGIASVGPYLHDGRATTLEDAILMHGGEAQRARDAAAELDEDEMADLVEFLMSLGGRDQLSQGLLEVDDSAPPAGEYGGPATALSGEALARFEEGRRMFDTEFGLGNGVGGPRFNGDSCRACHFEPTIGGAGPVDVNVMRHGILNEDGEFTEPVIGTILHRSVALLDQTTEPQVDCDVFEHRNTPHLFGLGLIDAIPEEAIVANADPTDTVTPDGITGRVSHADGGGVGRFGWKAQVPSVEEFTRDALTAEMGLTLPYVPGLVFGKIHDNDDVPDPEISLEVADLITDYLMNLGPPPRTGDLSDPMVMAGELVFGEVGCDLCHIPSLPGAAGPVPLYSDLLLHETLPEGAPGIEEVSANVREFRTAPLWGIATTAPYMHDGRSETIADAIAAHDGEAIEVRDAYDALDDASRAALLAFLETL